MEAIVACCGSGRYRGTMSCGALTGIKDYELCDNPEEYMFFDAVHPTEKTYMLIAELLPCSPIIAPKTCSIVHLWRFSVGCCFKVVEKQLKQKLGDAAAKKLTSEAVYFFSIGSNDYFVFVRNSTLPQSYNSKKEYVGMVIGNLTTTIKKGGRKFGFINLAPLGCTPSARLVSPGNTGSCLEDTLELAKLHNQVLSKVLQELEGQLEGFRYANHDFYNSLMKRINDPSRYGLKESMRACCGSGQYRGMSSCGGKRGVEEYELCDNPQEYLFFDFTHPSEKANKQIAQLLWSGTPDVTGPYNLKKLFEHS
ncbi:hypothetical protein Pint_29358 [Pistacia integerrima]|uniref:Uncharacterized protein n=1 Tax=Pistacia integerrima TaxID=434235 RepID=A0ACC0X0A0_9ROSI|nr:hypothetical protein Pint_29358 [Pistacia integerrima]